MRGLVLGSGGFIGRHLLQALEARGGDVTPADIVETGQNGLLLIQAAAPDYIVNCSGAASVPKSFDDPFADYQLNAVKVAQLLEAARLEAPGARIIHFSSAAVYGNATTDAIDEGTATAPMSPYGWHKLQAEQLCREYAALFGMRTISLRVFSAYGPGLKKQLFWDFYVKARDAQRVEMFGTGRERRDFIFVADIAAAVAAVLDRATFDGGAVNIASGSSVSINDALAALTRALGWRREIVFTGAERTGDPVSWRADIAKLRALGFSPSVPLEAGMERVAQWLGGL